MRWTCQELYAISIAPLLGGSQLDLASACVFPDREARTATIKDSHASRAHQETAYLRHHGRTQAHQAPGIPYPSRAAHHTTRVSHSTVAFPDETQWPCHKCKALAAHHAWPSRHIAGVSHTCIQSSQACHKLLPTDKRMALAAHHMLITHHLQCSQARHRLLPKEMMNASAAANHRQQHR